MSKYYSVQTSNKFGGLNLDSDNEEVLSTRPQHLIDAEFAALEKERQENKKIQDKAKAETTEEGERKVPFTNKGGNNFKKGEGYKGNRENNNNRENNRPRGEGYKGGANRKPKDGEKDGDNRGADAMRQNKRAEDSQKKVFDGKAASGKKQLDRKSNVKKATEDTDPKHQTFDAEKAENDNEEKTGGEDTPKTVEVEVITKTTLKHFLEEQRENRFVIEESGEAPAKYDELQKEMLDAGFKHKAAYANPDDVKFAQDTKKIVRGDVKLSVDELVAAHDLGSVPSQAKFMNMEVYAESEMKINDVKSSYGGRDYRNDKFNKKKPEVKKQVVDPSIIEETQKLKEIGKRACKNEEMFPGLD